MLITVIIVNSSTLVQQQLIRLPQNVNCQSILASNLRIVVYFVTLFCFVLSMFRSYLVFVIVIYNIQYMLSHKWKTITVNNDFCIHLDKNMKFTATIEQPIERRIASSKTNELDSVQQVGLIKSDSAITQ